MAKNKQKSSVTTILVRIVAVLLLVIGLVLIFNKQISNQMIKHNQQSALTTLTKKQVEANQKKKGMYDFSKVKSMNMGQAARSQVKKTSGAIGALAVPDVNMYLPIMLGLSDDAMSTGGGTMRADQVMGKGNYPLAGHYMTAKGILFSPLEDVKKEQRIYLTNLKKIYIYRIYMKKIVDPSAVWLVNNTKKNIVTLITCADGGTNRWAIRGNLIKTEKATDENLKVFKLK
ncbi:class A sortase [Lactobacillus acidophilus]|uniref:class A sortase n=1 Tax=Lactobacillus acidophilus TaxID=1579 RepID=UPI0021A5BD9A|nr:class A sortase [Lactobacillus acidophilus]MCT3601522.1 class A sortase [Lactobacillus acidophilus]MCT3624300.1 class A sortase [Lactobacillus acidophilus]